MASKQTTPQLSRYKVSKDSHSPDPPSNTSNTTEYTYQQLQPQLYAPLPHPPVTPARLPGLSIPQHHPIIYGQQHAIHPAFYSPHQPLLTTESPYDFSTPYLGHPSTQVAQSPALSDSPEGVFKVNTEGHRTSPRKSKNEPGVGAVTTGKSKAKKSKVVNHETKAVAKGKGKGSKSGANAREAGKSDDEIMVLSKDEMAQAALPVTMARAQWTEAEKVDALSYIVDERRWPDFKINQNTIFNHVSCNVVLLCTFALLTSS